MKIFPPDLDISDSEGFSAKDLFGRAELGRGLSHFVSTVSDPMVIALDAQWGSGKTTFLKMWAGELRKVGFPVVYFDAFEHDYFDDAFLAIAGEIIALAEDKRQADTPAGQKFYNKAKGVAKVLGGSGLRLAVKAATLGAVDTVDLGDTVNKVIEATGSEAEKLLDKHVSDLLARQKEQKVAIEQFREALSDLPALLAPPPSTSEGSPAGSNPLIFIMDELDRCRPIFALQVLERIKHFFSVENVHFVLGVHLGQLRNSVVSAYGANIDARLYLEKFIHLTVPLVDVPQDERYLTPGRYIEHLAKTLELPPKNLDELVRELSSVANRLNFSLRTVERIMTTVALSLAFAGKLIQPPILLADLCILKVTHPHLFVKAKLGTLTLSEVSEALDLGWPADEHNRWRKDVVLGFWVYCLGGEMADEDLRQYRSAIQSPFLDRNQILPTMANGIVGRLMPSS
jgi:hypothetical protein